MPDLPKFTICCSTFLRPHLLPRMIRCFLAQDYVGPKELIILDDAGQYVPHQEAEWQLLSIDRRFRSLGEKRNACAHLASADTKYMAAWDDDDLYEPWAMSAVAAGLRIGPFVWPTKAIDQAPDGTRKERYSTNPLHPSWGYRREYFDELGGYPPISLGEDTLFAKAANRKNAIDPIALGFRPYFIHCHDASTYHLSRNELKRQYGDIDQNEIYLRREKGIWLKL